MHAAYNRVHKIIDRAEALYDSAHEIYIAQVTKILEGTTKISAAALQELIKFNYCQCRADIWQEDDDFSNEIELKTDNLTDAPGSSLAMCPRLVAKRIICTKGKCHDYRMLDAVRSDACFSVRLYSPTERYSRNYKMRKDFALLEELIKKAAG